SPTQRIPLTLPRCACSSPPANLVPSSDQKRIAPVGPQPTSRSRTQSISLTQAASPLTQASSRRPSSDQKRIAPSHHQLTSRSRARSTPRTPSLCAQSPPPSLRSPSSDQKRIAPPFSSQLGASLSI